MSVQAVTSFTLVIKATLVISYIVGQTMKNKED